MSQNFSSFTPRFEQIRQGLEQVRARGLKAFGSESHGFKLNHPLSLEKLERFEHGIGARLPDEYRQFLLELGNGGAGPDYGLYALEKGEKWYDGKATQPLSLPALLAPNMPVNTPWNEALGCDSDDLFQGLLTLATQGCTLYIFLVVSGVHRGKIIYADVDENGPPYFTCFPDFLTWYETWLRELLAGYEMSNFGYGLPLAEPELVKTVCDPDRPLEDKHAALRTLLRAPQLEPELVSKLEEHLLFTEPNTAISLLNLLAKQGVQNLEGQALNLFERSSAQDALRIVYALQTAESTLWRSLARHLLERDELEIGSSVLFLLKRQNALGYEDVRLGFASQHGETRSTALYANSELENPLETPVELFRDPNPSTRRNAVFYLKDPELYPHLEDIQKLLLLEPEAFVRQGWVGRLGRHLAEGSNSLTTTFLKCLDTEPALEVLDALVHAVGRERVREAVPSLILLTRHEDVLLHLFVAEALGKIGDRRAIQALEALLKEDFSPMRTHSQGASGHIHTTAYVAREALKAIQSKVKPHLNLSQ